MSLPDSPLDPGLLYMFVLGPGVGESIAIRLPSDQWIIVDSYDNDELPAVEPLLEEFGGTVELIVLTHPHRDHYGGIIALVEKYDAALIGCVHPRKAGVDYRLIVDPVEQLQERSKPTYRRVWDAWTDAPGRKWETFRGRSVTVGDASLRSLHPDEPTAARHWSDKSYNDLSSAMWLEWNSVRILLGADVTNRSWESIAATDADLRRHHVLKVPHHVSTKAIHDSFGNGDKSRRWVATPFAMGHGLPPPEFDAGLAKALEFVDSIDLTSLPFSHDCEHESPCPTTRNQMASNHRPKRLGKVTEDVDDRAQRYVVLAYDKLGNLVNEWHGAGTVVVRE